MPKTMLWHALCLVIAVGALAAAAWSVLSGQQGIDGLFLLVVCLLTAATFAFLPIEAIRRGELQGLRKRRAPPSAVAAAAAPSAEPREKTNAAN